MSRPGLSWTEVPGELLLTMSLLCASNPRPSQAPGAVSSFSAIPWASGQGSGRSRPLLVSALSLWENSGSNCLWISRGLTGKGRQCPSVGLFVGKQMPVNMHWPSQLSRKGENGFTLAASLISVLEKNKLSRHSWFGCFSSLKTSDLAQAWRSRI